jgi:hypothetical protein
VALLAAFVAFAAVWSAGSVDWLVDPGLQADDARTHRIGFHAYGPEGPCETTRRGASPG